MDWTLEQSSAIESREKNLLVAAAAGSGKTAVLVERIVKMISDGLCNADEILVMTFTNAAAAEMRTRIHKAITKKMHEATEQELIERLERQAILLGGASVMTIHAFCQSVLRRHFSKIELDPKFRTGDTNELEILKREVLENLFEKKYEDYEKAFEKFSAKFKDNPPENFDELFSAEYPAETSFIKFTDEFGGNVHGDDKLYNLILQVYDFSQSRPYPDEWLKSLPKFYENPDKVEVEPGKTWFDVLKNFALKKSADTIQLAEEDCRAVKEIIIKEPIRGENFTPKDLQKIRKNRDDLIQVFDSDLNYFQTLRNCTGDWDGLYKNLSDKNSFAKYPGNIKLSENLKALKSEMGKRRTRYKKKILTLTEKIIASPLQVILDETKNLADPVRRLSEVIPEFAAAFAAEKRERGIIDFNDMEHLALKIFNEDKSVAESYRQKFKFIMVDEYQDTNGVQEEIVGKIVGERNFFAVGDVKQSIYRFRNADPEIFLQKYEDYPKLKPDELTKKTAGRHIDLAKNFRSRRQIIDAVNAIFRRLMTKEAMEIEYDRDAELNFGATRDYPEHADNFDEKSELCIIVRKNSDDTGNENFSDDENSGDEEKNSGDIPTHEDLNKLETETQFIANRINKMMSEGKLVWDGDKKIYRPLQFRDIVILLRAADGKTEKMIDILGRNGIKAYAADKRGYFDAPEIKTMLNLLNILDNARQDIPLAAVMLSPIGGFGTEDLAQLRIDARIPDLYTLIKNRSEESGELAERCKIFLEKINRWRKISLQVGVPELLSVIYTESGYYDYFGKSPDGKIPQANLRMLTDRAANYEATAFRGLSRFIKFMEKIRERENDLSAARTLGESEDVVRIMTIHKSKGLEFPVVFVAEIGKIFNLRDLSEPVILHRKFGAGILKNVQENSGTASLPTVTRNIIKEQSRAENLAEEMRILYVALTRAKEKLIIVTSVKSEKYIGNFSRETDERLSAGQLLDAKSPGDWLLMIKNFVQDVIDVKQIDAAEISPGDAKFAEEKNFEPEEELQTPDRLESSPLENIPAKFSVTELKRRITEAEEEENFSQPEEIFGEKVYKKNPFRRPNFLREKRLSNTEFGTLMHTVMQQLDLSGRLDREGISEQIDGMVERKIILPEHAGKVKEKSDGIAKFFAGDLGQKVVRAKEIYRELPFIRYIEAEKLQAGKIFENVAGEKIFIQGIIDLLFKDSASGNWILLDYKTDRENSDEHFRKEYGEQIRLYSQAVESLLNLKIAEKYLYLLGSARLISMNNL